MGLEQMIRLAEMNPEEVADEIGDFIVSTIVEIGKTGGVIGLSGGVDSTCVAALAKMAFDNYNIRHSDRPLELIGYILPSDTNSKQDTIDGIKVAEKLGIRYEVLSIEPIIKAFESTNPEAVKEKFHKGNLMSRVRANILSTKAATEQKTVLGTGNKDEDFGVGYYTLFGDGAVHCSPIGNLNKRLVKQMACYLGFEDIARKQSSPGLEPGQTSFKDLGYSYETVELILEGFYQGFTPKELAGHSQIKAQVIPELKDNAKFSRMDEVIRDVLGRHNNIAMPKMQIVHPPAAEVTLNHR